MSATTRQFALASLLIALSTSHRLVAADEATTQERAADLAEPVRLISADHAVAAPTFGDLDGDGKDELIVGEFRQNPYLESGFRVYRRVGEKSKLQFDAGHWLEAGGQRATAPSFCYTGSAPQIVDFDRDGQVDLVSAAMTGERSRATLRVFRGLGKGRFAEPTDVTFLIDEKSPREFSCYNVRTFVYDWDRDGRMDILATMSGKLWLVRATGPRVEGGYAAPTPIMAGNEPIKVGLGSIDMADWDGDGLEDLILGGSRGDVRWFRNTSPRGEPVLAAGAVLVPTHDHQTVRYERGQPYPRPDSPCRTPRVCATDVNGDGRVDLVVGDWANALVTSPEPTAEQTLAREEAQRRLQTLRTALYELESSDEPPTAQARDERSKRIDALRDSCSAAFEAVETLRPARQERHGSVWLYKRLVK